jgi:D-amino-acid dehydrogenase
MKNDPCGIGGSVTLMDAMARFDAIVLGAGIVGTSVALHLIKRGLSVALIDRRAPGEETSYGNAGVIEGNTLFPPVFPSSLLAVLRVALKRATEANYHLAFLPHVAPWLLSYRLASRPEKLIETARIMRPLFNRAVAEHETLLAEANAAHYMCREGWLKVYRSDATFAALAPELALATEYGIPHRRLDFEGARVLEPNLGPIVRHAVQWSDVTSVSNPLAVTRAYAARFTALGGTLLSADARSLRRINGGWRVDTMDGPREAGEVVLALGPFTGEVLGPLGLKLPLGIKRGYHLHFQPGRNVTLTRPVLDADIGYCLASMTQGIRLTTGAEFAHRDAPATPVQFDRLMPAARQLFPLGEPVEAMPWMGSRPCFADSRPVIGPAPGHPGLWLAYGHAHWGLTLGPATGRLIAEMMTAAVPFCDPKPYGAERFMR